MTEPELPPSPPGPPPPPPAERFWAALLQVIAPGLGLALLGRRRLGWVVFALVSLAMAPLGVGFPALVAFVLVWLGNVIAPLVVRRGPRLANRRMWLELVARLVLSIAVAIAVRNFLAEAYRIPSGAMIPTLQIGDKIYVARWDRDVGRGDVVVFRYPREPGKDFIKRVIAVGGDRVEVRANVPIVNGEPVPRTPVPGPCDYHDRSELGWEEKPCVAYEERLGHRTYRVQVDENDWSRDFPGPQDESPYVVPEGHVFVLGDNRNNSHDSRYWGAVPLDHLKGTARYVWWSTGPDEVRWERIGRAVE